MKTNDVRVNSFGLTLAENLKFARRLMILAEFLYALPPGRFDLRSWAGSDDHPYMGRKDLSCGTTACALGWATTLPFVRRLGITLERRCSRGVICSGDLVDVPNVAGLLAFRLTLQETWALFSPSNLNDNRYPHVYPHVRRLDDVESAAGVADNILSFVLDKHGYVGTSKAMKRVKNHAAFYVESTV